LYFNLEDEIETYLIRGFLIQKLIKIYISKKELLERIQIIHSHINFDYSFMIIKTQQKNINKIVYFFQKV
jgi:hypothetical protein